MGSRQSLVAWVALRQPELWVHGELSMSHPPPRASHISVHIDVLIVVHVKMCQTSAALSLPGPKASS